MQNALNEARKIINWPHLSKHIRREHLVALAEQLREMEAIAEQYRTAGCEKCGCRDGQTIEDDDHEGFWGLGFCCAHCGTVTEIKEIKK